jgi:hypothetical protein
VTGSARKGSAREASDDAVDSEEKLRDRIITRTAAQIDRDIHGIDVDTHLTSHTIYRRREDGRNIGD